MIACWQISGRFSSFCFRTVGLGGVDNGAEKSLKRLKKNEALCDAIEAVASSKHNASVTALYNQLLLCMENGFEYASQINDQKKEQIQQFGSLPKHPAPPLPYGRKWSDC